MPRRFKRTYARVPVDLVSLSGSEGFSEIGSIRDISQGGLRVQTGPQLIEGRMLHVFLEGSTKPFASCRVVWSRSRGGGLPSEAGLQILERLPSRSAPVLQSGSWSAAARSSGTA